MENINPSMMAWIISIGGFLLVSLLGIIVYFLQRLIKSTDTLQETVSELQLLVRGQQTSCFEKHVGLNQVISIMDAKLTNTSEKVNKIENEVSEIRGQLNPI